MMGYSTQFWGTYPGWGGYILSQPVPIPGKGVPTLVGGGGKLFWWEVGVSSLVGGTYPGGGVPT